MARFRFDTNLIETLGQQYKSCEAAIIELVANAWYADSDRVEISLPKPMTADSIVVTDNGYGMSPSELQNFFLVVGYDRRQSRGSETPMGRKVRGIRGIGKFAGLQIAETMSVLTIRAHQCSKLILNRRQLSEIASSLEVADIPVITESTSLPNGTRIELSGIRQAFTFPSTLKLGRLVLREFGRQDGFAVYIDGDLVSSDVLSGQKNDLAISLRDGRTVHGAVWITEKVGEMAEPGIIVRVNGRAIGPPTFFGLDDDPDVPKTVLRRIVGEVHADHLINDVTANWGEFVENSVGYQDLAETMKDQLRNLIQDTTKIDAGAAPNEFVDSFRDEIERLPRSRRDLAREALYRVFQRFYDEAADRKRAVAELVLNAFELDEYWVLVQRIDQMSNHDVAHIADILEQWGLYEISGIAERAKRRLAVVDRFEDLVWDDTTLELQHIHRVLERNVWLIGDEWEVATSNRTMRRLIMEVFGDTYQGALSGHRPDLFLAGAPDRHLLVELKRPSHEVELKDIYQVQRYRNDILLHLPVARIETIVIGGTISPGLKLDEQHAAAATTFKVVLLEARRRLEWLVSNLIDDADDTLGRDVSASA